MATAYYWNPDDPLVPNIGVRYVSRGAAAGAQLTNGETNPAGEGLIRSLGVRGTKWDTGTRKIVALTQADKDAIKADSDAKELARLRAQAKAALDDLVADTATVDRAILLTLLTGLNALANKLDNHVIAGLNECRSALLLTPPVPPHGGFTKDQLRTVFEGKVDDGSADDLKP